MDQSSPFSIGTLVTLAIFFLPLIAMFVFRAKDKKAREELKKARSIMANLSEQIEILEAKSKPFEEAKAVSQEAKRKLDDAKNKAQEIIAKGLKQADQSIAYLPRGSVGKTRACII